MIKKKINIVHVCAIDWTVQYMLKPQIIALQKDGYDVCVMCSSSKYLKELEQCGISIIQIDVCRAISPLKDLQTLWQLYRKFRKGEFDIVHTHTPKISLLGQMAAYFAKVPVVINTVHGFYFHDDMRPLKHKFYVSMEKIAAKFSSRILSQNKEDIDTAIKLKICKPKMIRQLGNGIDLNRFCRQRFDANFAIKKRKDLNLPADAFVVGIVGRLVREKGYMELFEAVSNLLKKGYNIRLLSIGPKEHEKPDAISISETDGFGITEKVHFCGQREDVDELMMAMDIYALPSYREGYPRSAMEASAMFLPVVATDIRGCREVVDDGETGFLVPVRNAEALELAIEKLIKNKELRFKMGKKARKKAETVFDEQNVIGIILEEYKKLLDK